MGMSPPGEHTNVMMLSITHQGEENKKANSSTGIGEKENRFLWSLN